MKPLEIAIIGGGAAGMMAALGAAERGAKVTILEATARIGNKILLTGNGKCNFANEVMDESCYYCKDENFVPKIFEQFSPKDLCDFFERNGMFYKSKNGYLYPYGEQASIVLDILRYAIKRSGVKVVENAKVLCITKNAENFLVETENGQNFLFDKVILCTGGRSYPKTGSDGSGYKIAKKMGHSVFPTVPALVQLCGNDSFYKMIAGVRSEGVVSLKIDNEFVRKERGEIQFTDYGISGIPVFQLSRLASYGLYEKKEVSVFADVLPDVSKEDLKETVLKRYALYKDGTLEEFMCGLVNKKLSLLAIHMAGKKAQGLVKDATVDDLNKIVMYLKNIEFHINQTKSFDTAQVTAGGVLTDKLDANLQSKCTKGLYFAGEIVDVDGICGGYNLQWAFISGYIAGRSAAQRKGEMN